MLNEITELQELDKKDEIIGFRINSKIKVFLKKYCEETNRTLTEFITNSIFFCIGLTKRIQVLEAELEKLKGENKMSNKKKIEIEIPESLYQNLLVITLLKKVPMNEFIIKELEDTIQAEENDLKGLGYNLDGLIKNIGEVING